MTTDNSITTERLLQRVHDREPQALEELFARHQERLRKMVRLRLDRRLRGQVTSSSVLSEVFQEASRHIDEYRTNPCGSFFLWLRQLTGQRLQALQQRHLGEQVREAEQEFSLYRGAMPQVHSMSLAAQLMGNRAAHRDAARADMLLRLQDALNGMDAMDREVLALCHFEELSEEEVAAVLGIDRDTATLRYLRALKRLKEILNGIPGFFDNTRKS